MTDISDEKMLDVAREIATKEGIPLVEAMLKAEVRLQPKADIPEEFTVSIRVKPKIARWILHEFQATPSHTTEQRLAAYLAIVLGRARVSAIRNAEIPPEISEGEAVTMRRDQFQARRPQ